jgi:hypothetical protein
MFKYGRLRARIFAIMLPDLSSRLVRMKIYKDLILFNKAEFDYFLKRFLDTCHY